MLGDTWVYRMRAATCSCPGGGNCASADCPSGYCVDGVCCEGASLVTTDPPSCGVCERCDSSANPGVCTPVKNAEDPDSCASPNTCGPDGVCGLPNGAPCTPGVTVCASGHCVDGVCCDSTCKFACEVCNAGTRGWPGGIDGVCTIAPAGYPSTCAPYVCDGTNPFCPFFCGSDDDCDADSHCNDLTGACVEDFALGASCSRDAQCQSGFCVGGVCVAKSELGEACTGADECASGHCVDGVCCDSTCLDPCAACDVPGSEGRCTAVVGAPHGDRPACEATSDEVCGATQCDGVTTTTCAGFVNEGQPCREASCTDGVAILPASCDGTGSCPAVETQNCAPYVCAGSVCGTSCEDDTDCAPPNVCAPDGRCVPPTADEPDAGSETDAGNDGGNEPDADDEADAGNEAEAHVESEQDAGCGCRMAGERRGGLAPVAMLGAAFALAQARRRRRVGAA